MPVRPYSAQINRHSWQARNLVGWYPASGDTYGTVPDRATNPANAPQFYGSANVVNIPGHGLAVDQSANARGWQGTAPTYIQSLVPVTLIYVGYKIAAASAVNAEFFGVSYTNADTSPYVQYTMGIANASTNDISCNWNSSGTLTQATYAGTYSAIPTGSLFVLGMTLAGSFNDFYTNGARQGTTGTSLSAINAGSNPYVFIGDVFSNSRHTGAFCLDARIYAAAWNEDEHRALFVNWTDLYARRGRRHGGRRSTTASVMQRKPLHLNQAVKRAAFYDKVA